MSSTAINVKECKMNPASNKFSDFQEGWESYPPISQRRHFSDNMCLESEEIEGLAINTQECKTGPVREKSPVGDKRHFLGNSNSSVFEEETPTRDARIEKEHSDLERNEENERWQFSESEVTEKFATHVQECKISPVAAKSPPGDKRHFVGKSGSSVFTVSQRRHFSDNMCLESEEIEGLAINTQECKTGPVKEKSPVGDKKHFLENSNSNVFDEKTLTRDARIEKEHSDREGNEEKEKRQFSESEVTEEFSPHVQECKISPVTAKSPPGDKRHFVGKSGSSVFEEETPTRNARIEKGNIDRMDFEKAQN